MQCQMVRMVSLIANLCITYKELYVYDYCFQDIGAKFMAQKTIVRFINERKRAYFLNDRKVHILQSEVNAHRFFDLGISCDS